MLPALISRLRRNRTIAPEPGPVPMARRVASSAAKIVAVSHRVWDGSVIMVVIPRLESSRSPCPATQRPYCPENKGIGRGCGAMEGLSRQRRAGIDCSARGLQASDIEGLGATAPAGPWRRSRQTAVP